MSNDNIRQGWSRNNGRLFLCLIVLVLPMLLIGCGGDDDPTDPNRGGNNGGNNGGGGSNTFSATVDGVTWTAVAVQAINNAGVLGVGASDAGGDFSIGLGWVDTGASSYTFAQGVIANATVIGTDGTSWQAMGDDGSGTITITSLSSEAVAGTFSFTAPRLSGTGDPMTRVVTNGTFNVDF